MIKLKSLLNDKTLIKWGLFCAIAAALLYALYSIMKNFGQITGAIAAALSSFSSAIAPLFIGIVIAYLLSPVVETIDRKFLARVFFKMPENPIQRERWENARFLLGVIITFILIFAAICATIYGFAILMLGRSAFTDFPRMLEDITSYFTAYESAVKDWAASLPQDAVSDKINDVVNSVANWFSNSFSASAIISFISNISGSIINMILGVIVSIYLLKDKRFFLSLCRKASNLLLPQKANAIAREILHEINTVFSQFIRGALLDALIIAFLSSLLLYIIGVQFAVFIGCFAGIANIIPYFGPVLGMIPAFIVAILTEGLTQAIMAVALLFILQQFDASFIYPKIVGVTVGMHPLFVLLAITAAGYYGGILGMVIAVPIAGIIKIFVLKFVLWLENKKSL